MQVLTHSPLLKALGWALFDSLWQMAALWLLYSLLMAIFSSAAARIRHRLALLLLSIGACWTGITFFEALFFPDNSSISWLPLLSPARSAPGWFWQTSRSFIDTFLASGSSLYLLILACLLVRYSSYYWHTRKLTRNGLSTMPPEFRVFVAATALQLGIHKPVRAWLSSLIDVPLTLGFLKPVILLPVAMISQLTPQQVEAILIHELSHIQRKDYLLHLVATLLEGLFFFNPFSRLLIRQLSKEREHSCDDLVLQFKYDPHSYVSALLSLATRHRPLRELAVAATGDNDKLLLERARRILLQQESNRSRPGTRSLLLLLFTGMITALALYRPLLPDRQIAPATTRTALTATHPAPATTRTASPTDPSQQRALSSLTAATSREFAFALPIQLTPPRAAPEHPTALAHPRQQVRPRTQITGDPDILQSEDNNAFVNTADNALSGDGSFTPMIASADDLTGGNAESGAYTRDYSLNMPSAIAGPSITIQQGEPIVPNSSFSFQYTQGDSARPEEQLLYLQLSAQRNVLAAIANLQQQTAVQLKALANLGSKATESVHMRRQIHSQQLKIQQDYLRKINTWQQKLEKTTHIRMIVYI